MLPNLLATNWNYFEYRIGGERVADFLWCAGIILATLLLKKPLAKLLAYLSAGLAKRFSKGQHGATFQELTRKPLEMLLQTILFYIALNQLTMLLSRFVLHRYKERHEDIAIRVSDVVDHVFLFLTILFATLVISRVVDFIYYVQLEKAGEEDNRDRQQLLPLMKEVTKLLVWVISAFWVLGSVMHVNIPALITSLGIGGVAIALAAKESVENLFAAFTILTDKPFETGDTIRLGNLEGTIERIGFRSTRLRNADGSMFVIPNQKLVNENVENLTQRHTRRVRFVVNIKYGVSAPNLQQMITELKQMLRNAPSVLEPAEVLLDTFNENAFQLVISYYLPHPLVDARLNDIKQDVNLKVFAIVYKYAGTSQATPLPDQQAEERKEEEE